MNVLKGRRLCLQNLSQFKATNKGAYSLKTEFLKDRIHLNAGGSTRFMRPHFVHYAGWAGL